MPKPSENVTLHVTFNTETKLITVDGNPTPVELFEIIVALQCQLVPVFQELDGQIRSRVSESKLITPARDLVVTNGKIH